MNNLEECTFYEQIKEEKDWEIKWTWILEVKKWKVFEDCLMKQEALIEKDVLDTIFMVPHEELTEVLCEIMFDNVWNKITWNYERYVKDIERIFESMEITSKHWCTKESLEHIKDVTLNWKTAWPKTEAIVHAINKIIDSN